MTDESDRKNRLRVIRRVFSPDRTNERDLHIYLPPSYEASDHHYPVVYMQDGQNLFDESLAFAGAWMVDESLDVLARAGLEAIVVGVPNLGTQRFDEYSPFKDARYGGGAGSRYVEFLTDTVKPRIDREFRTLRSREDTGIVGSSMGGLISLFAFFARTDVFGFAGAMSPALWFADRQIFDYVEHAPFAPGVIYLDIGTAEGTEAVEDARAMEGLLIRKGYVPGSTLLYVEEAGARHQEAAWTRRLAGMFSFLLPSCMCAAPGWAHPESPSPFGA